MLDCFCPVFNIHVSAYIGHACKQPRSGNDVGMQADVKME